MNSINMDNKNLGLILMDKLYKKYNLDKYTSGSSIKLRKLLIADLLRSVKGDKELEYTVKKMGYFDFNSFDKLKSDLVNEYNRRRENAVNIIKKHWKNSKQKRTSAIDFETVKINSAYKDYSSTWFIRRKLSEEEEKSIIRDGKKSSRSKKIPDKDFIKPHHHKILISDSSDSAIKTDATSILFSMNQTRAQLYEEHLNIHKNIRISEKLRCVFLKFGEDEHQNIYITVDLPEDKDTKQCNATLHNKNKIYDILNKHNEIMLNAIDTFVNNGSNYVLDSIIGMYCNIDKYQPLKARSYIELPPFIKNKQCCINVKNKDNYCFVYAILSCLKHDTIKKNKDRASSYDKGEVSRMISTIESLGITFPIQIINKNINKIENSLNIAINIYSFDYDVYENTYTRYPVYITDKNDSKSVNILYFTNDDKNYHYVWIKNFNSFLCDIVKDKNAKFFCTKCL